MIAVVRINRYRGNAELLNGSSSSSDTKIKFDLRFWYDRIFHFRVILYSSYSETKKKINLLRNEKVGNELGRLLGRWEKVEGSKRHLFFFVRPSD